ncbi:MFS transporter, partial [Arthrobacter sp. Br18]|uniref:MFS transporter n=1 Tax=Arthrobacter sp. Br18 TaxID=1312954 RepID=UPI0005693966
MPYPTRPSLTPRQLVFAITALAMGGFAIGTTEFAIMGLLQEMVDELGVSYTQGGHVISAYALGVVVGAPVLATLGAKRPQRSMAVWLMVAFVVANFSSYFAAGYGWMMASRFLSGLPHGAYFGVAAVIAASLANPTHRARAISMVMLGLSIANVVGVPFATWLGQQVGWRSLFLLVGVVGMVTIVLILRYVPFQEPHPDASIRRELGALRRPQMWLTLLIGTVGFGGFFAVYSYISPTITEVTGLPSSVLPIVVALYGVGMVAGNILGGRIADRSVMGSIYGVMAVVVVVLLLFPLAMQFPPTAFLFAFLVGASGS